MDERDRELLELAAKAAGISYVWEQEGYAYGQVGVVPVGWRRCWDPRSEWTTDAFELAIQLQLHIKHRDELVVVGRSNGEGDFVTVSVTDTASRADATRLAIIQAAAEIGRSMG